MPEETRPRRSGRTSAQKDRPQADRPQTDRPRIAVRVREGAAASAEGLSGVAGTAARAKAAFDPQRPLEVEDERAAQLLLDPSLQQVSSLDLEDLGLEVRIQDEEIRELFAQRLDSVTKVFRTLDHLRKDLGDLVPVVPPSLPPTISGGLVNPDGTGGRG